eukprot:GILK01014794.1.p1 GENE.GILK01014794.1~~GILK01014794.1.p1  ORF type:complete len:242 (+),score=35.58 GILK01014794.1:18-743(+)
MSTQDGDAKGVNDSERVAKLQSKRKQRKQAWKNRKKLKLEEHTDEGNHGVDLDAAAQDSSSLPNNNNAGITEGHHGQCDADGPSLDGAMEKRILGPIRPSEAQLAAASRLVVPPLDEEFEEEADGQEEKPCQVGLRCAKCFVRLVREHEFEYGNGQLWFSPKAPRWGFLLQHGKVYCKNMHSIGSVVPVSGSQDYVPCVRMEKTTFQANFINNPLYVNSEKIINKVRFPGPGAGRFELPPS